MKKGLKWSSAAKPAHPMEKVLSSTCTAQQEEESRPPAEAANNSNNRALRIRPLRQSKKSRPINPTRIVVAIPGAGIVKDCHNRFLRATKEPRGNGTI